MSTPSLPAISADLHILPDHPEYDLHRFVWNAAIDLSPTGIIRCQNTADVVVAVQIARQNNLTIAIRSGSHSPSGYGTCHDGLVLDLSGMKGIDIDAENQTARIEPGLTWRAVADALHEHGLALTSGDTGSVGVGGLTTGGGIGWMVGQYGLTIDRLRAVEIVTAAGEILRTSADENPDLFWAVRGGGGNFGVITAFEFDVHPGGLIYGGAVFYDATNAADILEAYSKLATEVPDELTTQVLILQAPPAPFIPPHFQGKPVLAVLLCHCGDHAEAESAIAPFKNLGPIVADLAGPMPYPALFSMAEAGEIRGLRHNFRSQFLGEVTREMTEPLMEEVLAAMTPSVIFQLRTIHGHARRVPAEDTAFSHRDKPFLLLIDQAYGDPTDEPKVTASMDRIEAIISPYSTGNHCNFLGLHQSDRKNGTYAETTHQRLTQIKHQYDPRNVFRHNWNIQPKT